MNGTAIAQSIALHAVLLVAALYSGHVPPVDHTALSRCVAEQPPSPNEYDATVACMQQLGMLTPASGRR